MPPAGNEQKEEEGQGQGGRSYFRPEVAAAQREAVPLDPRRTAVLFVDVQRYNLHREGAVWRDRRRRAAAEDESAVEANAAAEDEFFARVDACVPRWRLLLSAARRSGAEPLFTVIQSLTRDGRDRGLDYKLSGMHVAPGSPDARVLDEVLCGVSSGGSGGESQDAAEDAADLIVLPKSSSSPFASTSLEYLLRSLGRDQLLVCGALTDQCVSSTVREACDRGLRTTLAYDASVGSSAEAHAAAIEHIRGYCRVRASAECAAELMSGVEGGLEEEEGRGGGGGGGAER